MAGSWRVLPVVVCGLAGLPGACAGGEMGDEKSSLTSSSSGQGSSTGSSSSSSSSSSSGGTSTSSSGGSGGGGGSSNGGLNVSEPADGGVPDAAPNPGTLVSFGGAQDFAYFRQQLADGGLPLPMDMDSPGFFAEHATPLPPPACGDRDLCLHSFAAGDPGFPGSGARVLLQVGLNSRLRLAELPTPPRCLVLAVDASGSMAGRNLDRVVSGLRLLGEELDGADRWGLVSFGDDALVREPLQAFDQARWQDAVEALDGMQGATNISAGLLAGLGLLEGVDHAACQRRVLLLTDGMANRGITDREELVAAVLPGFQRGVGLTAVGVGWQFDPALLRRLAESAGGTYYFADGAGALEEIFREELRTFTVPVGYAVALHVEAGAAWDLRAAWGAPGFRVAADGRSGDLVLPAVTLSHRSSAADHQRGRRGGGSALLVELVASAHPEAHAQSTAADLRAPDALAATTLSYLAADGVPSPSERQRVDYPPGPGVVPPRGYFPDPAGEKNAVMLALYLGLQRGSVMGWSGKAAEAVPELDALGAAVAAWNATRGDDDIGDDLVWLRRLRDTLAAR